MLRCLLLLNDDHVLAGHLALDGREQASPVLVLVALGLEGVAGEGEELICSLTDALARGERPAEPLMRAPLHLAGSSIPSALYDPTILGFYQANGKMVSIQTKRGCPYRCSYCSYPVLEGKNYRLRDPEEVAAEVIRVGAEYYYPGIRKIAGNFAPQIKPAVCRQV